MSFVWSFSSSTKFDPLPFIQFGIHISFLGRLQLALVFMHIAFFFKENSCNFKEECTIQFNSQRNKILLLSNGGTMFRFVPSTKITSRKILSHAYIFLEASKEIKTQYLPCFLGSFVKPSKACLKPPNRCFEKLGDSLTNSLFSTEYIHQQIN